MGEGEEEDGALEEDEGRLLALPVSWFLLAKQGRWGLGIYQELLHPTSPRLLLFGDFSSSSFSLFSEEDQGGSISSTYMKRSSGCYG